MTSGYSAAHHRLDHILKFFFVLCLAGVTVGIAHYDWWFVAIWVVAGFINGVIGASVVKNAATPTTPEDDEFLDRRVFVKNVVNFAILIAVVVLAAGFRFGQPWWAALIAAWVALMASIFGTLLLCLHRVLWTSFKLRREMRRDDRD